MSLRSLPVLNSFHAAKRGLTLKTSLLDVRVPTHRFIKNPGKNTE